MQNIEHIGVNIHARHDTWEQQISDRAVWRRKLPNQGWNISSPANLLPCWSLQLYWLRPSANRLPLNGKEFNMMSFFQGKLVSQHGPVRNSKVMTSYRGQWLIFALPLCSCPPSHRVIIEKYTVSWCIAADATCLIRDIIMGGMSYNTSSVHSHIYCYSVIAGKTSSYVTHKVPTFITFPTFAECKIVISSSNFSKNSIF